VISVENAAPLILRLDVTGRPIDWTNWQDAVCLYAKERVVWFAGKKEFKFVGGTSRLTGKQSSVSVNSIIAVRGSNLRIGPKKAVPPLSNRELFLRDDHLCMYCGSQLQARALTRDHVIPLYYGGKNHWTNLVTACRACNARKGGRTPEEAKMPLLAVPYEPNWTEYLVLTNRKILADQMDFLKSQLGKNSRVLSKLA
jgi:hypothetical protein